MELERAGSGRRHGYVADQEWEKMLSSQDAGK